MLKIREVDVVPLKANTLMMHQEVNRTSVQNPAGAG